MSSLQDVLTGPKSKVSALDADTRSYDPPPGLVRPDKECEETELAKVRIPPQVVACKCVICHRDCCWFPTQHLTHRCAEHKYW